MVENVVFLGSEHIGMRVNACTKNLLFQLNGGK